MKSSPEQEGKIDRAIYKNRGSLQQNPGSPEIRQSLADDLARAGRCEDASQSANSVAGPMRAAWEAVAGICYFRVNEVPAALAHLKQSVALSSEVKQTAIFLGRAHAVSGKPGEGVRILKAFMSSHKEDPDILYWIGVFYDQLAQQTYEAMAKSNPDSYLVLETQGDQLLQQQKYDDALNAYRRALKLAPDAAGIHFDVGNTYWRMAKLDDAAQELSAELKVNPAHAQANYELGDIAVRQGNVDRGVALLNKALALNPALVDAHRSLGRAYLQKREYAEALSHFSIVESAEPSDHTIHALLANVYQRMGRTQKAEEETRKYNELIGQQATELRHREAEQSGGEASPVGPRN